MSALKWCLDHWRWFLYAAAAIAALWMLGLIRHWHSDSLLLEEAQKALKDEIACAPKTHCMDQVLAERQANLDAAEKALRAQNTLAKETEDALQLKVAEIDKRYLAAADRLAHIRVCNKTGLPRPSTTPTTPGEPGSPGPSDEGDGTSVAGLGPILRDCELDAADYDAVKEWYAGLRKLRNGGD